MKILGQVVQYNKIYQKWSDRAGTCWPHSLVKSSGWHYRFHVKNTYLPSRKAVSKDQQQPSLTLEGCESMECHPHYKPVFLGPCMTCGPLQSWLGWCFFAKSRSMYSVLFGNCAAFWHPARHCCDTVHGQVLCCVSAFRPCIYVYMYVA